MKQQSKPIDYEILPPHLAIKSMRDSGYRDTAHALAELVDNSIQAGLPVNEVTNVEILCIDKVDLVSERRRQRISEIAVYDNASGMDAETLRIALQFGNGTHLRQTAQDGIGKFGMGLPNASISQCERVDVWSWQNGHCLHTYISIEEVLAGKLRTVPEPKVSSLPPRWSALIRDEKRDHGTLVVWSEIDRVRWKTSFALLKNAEFLIGRIYRYFLKEGRACIRLAAFEENSSGFNSSYDHDVLPNDPLYLMTGTCTPSPFDSAAAFDLVTEYPLDIDSNGGIHKVKLKFSVTKKDARHSGGSSPIGKHAAKNQGVSVVRAGRELELNRTFENRYDPTDRWWGVEVNFSPELDYVFGVTNNKQSATAFMQCDLDEDASAEGLTPGEYEEMLRQSGDPRLAIYKISQEISKMLGSKRGTEGVLRQQIARLGEGSRKAGELLPPPGSAEDIATRATQKRRELMGKQGKSDADEKLPEEVKQAEISAELITEGVAEEEAKEIAVENVTKNFKYLFQEAPVPGTSIFDIRSKAGTIIILLNTRHPANEHLFASLKCDDVDHPALKALKLLLTAWARLEDESGDVRRQQLEDIRSDWGRIARDFLSASEE